MGLLKRIWDRIVVSYARPAKGHGVSGSADLEASDVKSDYEGEHAAQSSDQWKSHGGFRK